MPLSTAYVFTQGVITPACTFVSVGGRCYNLVLTNLRSRGSDTSQYPRGEITRDSGSSGERGRLFSNIVAVSRERNAFISVSY